MKLIYSATEKAKQYYLDNRVKMKEYQKQYHLDNYNLRMISRWKKTPKSGGLGLISNDYLSIFNRWKDSTSCEKCSHDYSYYRKCMDHCHSTGAFRAILCHKCNSNDKVNNTSGYPNISYDKTKKIWRYEKMEKKILHQKQFKTKYEAIIYKWLYEAGYSIEF